MKKNLIYYSYFNLSNIPVYIHYHLKLLQRYAHVFNGLKVIYIATDDEVVDETQYTSLFNFFPDAIFKVVKNHPEHRESEYFLEQLNIINGQAEKDSITFFGHSKGTTYEQKDTVLKWITAMYYFNLEENNRKVIDAYFSTDKIFAGTFKVEVPCDPWVCVPWHYSGTFFWINNSKLFANELWKEFKPGRFAVEEFPGRVSELHQGANSQILFSTRTESKLFYPYTVWDLRYPPYWEEFFGEKSPLVSDQDLYNFKTIMKELTHEQ